MSGATRNRISSYLAPDQLPTHVLSRQLLIPDDFNVLAAVSDVLAYLSLPGAWIPSENVTEDQMIALMAKMNYGLGVSMIGYIWAHVRNTIPSWALSCDGATHLRVDYPDLYAVLPPPLIVDADHFTTPNLNLSRSPRGTTNPALYGNAGGSETQSISIANLPSHNHPEVTAVAAVGAAVTGVPVASAIPGTGTTGNTGGGTAITFFPRHILVGYIIVAK